MRILFTGGSACGKSTYAERLLMERSGPGYYIDAMLHDAETRPGRTEKHRRLSSKKEIQMIGRCTDISGICLTKRGTVLFECLCSLTANEMFGRDGAGRKRAKEAVLTGIEALAEQCRDMIVITNEVGSDGGGYSRETEEYIEVLGQINTEMAAGSDVVIEMVCGIPVFHKGMLPDGSRSSMRNGPLLITGAAGSGKRSYIRSLGWKEKDMADAVLDERRVVYHAENMAGRMEHQYLVRELLKKDAVIINEVGCGIIPADANERVHRLEAGKLAIQLAAQAGHVIRLISGIPVVIK